MTATALLPIFYHGDATIRGLARLPTVMTTADVAQGAGSDTNIASVLPTAQSQYDAYVGGFTGGDTPPIATPTQGGQGGVDCPWYSIDPRCWGQYAKSGYNAAQPSGSPDCTDISIDHPIDAATCLLDRFLFGIVAIVLLGLGVYIFAKD
jgi:hypothetical protein